MSLSKFGNIFQEINNNQFDIFYDIRKKLQGPQTWRLLNTMISRLTSDVQDFKSAFKLTVSQGLKATTQVIPPLPSLNFSLWALQLGLK